MRTPDRPDAGAASGPLTSQPASQPASPSLILQARKLRAARGVTVATGVRLAAAPGEVIAVEGPNGSGKTTLLAAAAGLLPDGNDTVRPGLVGYAPERASQLPRVPVSGWLASLGRTAGLSREDSAARTGDLLRRLGLDPYAARTVNALSRGNTQRALVAQALIADPDLVILDEPAGGLDEDGVRRVAGEITRAASRDAVVLVATHPAAPVPLPPGTTWRFADGQIRTEPRAGVRLGAGFEVETGDGRVHQVAEGALPGLLRAALDAGVPIRRVQPASELTPAAAPLPRIDAERAQARAVRRQGTGARLLHGALHRAWLLAASQWFAAPMLLFLIVLALVYATDAGSAPLQPDGFVAITLFPVMMWLTVHAHRVDGRELGRAFAVHIGGRSRAHLAADVAVLPYGVALSVVAVVWALASQGEHPHPPLVILRMTALLIAAAVFGVGLGSALALIERMGWRLIVAVAAFLVLVLGRYTPLTPLLKLATSATTASTVGTQCALMVATGAALAAAAAVLARRLS